MSDADQVLEFAFDGAAVRALMIGGNPWFVAADVCRVLGLGNPTRAISSLDVDEKCLTTSKPFAGMGYGHNLISELGLYALVLRSRQPAARKFCKWVTSEVLPAIRRHGVYVHKPLSASKVRLAAEVLLVATHERAVAEGGAGLDERSLFRELARRVVADHPEWIVAAIGQWLHDCVYHALARREKRLMQSYDPVQPVLPNLFSVMRAGRERAVARLILTQAEKLHIVGSGFRSRAGFLKFADRLRRRDRALVDEHNEAHPAEAITIDMLALRAPDLLH